MKLETFMRKGGPTPGIKPPPLTVVTSATKTTRTTATVTPLSQSASTVTVTSGNSHAMAATRTSSFAAALRKLAKQATDNGPEDASPRASPASTTHSHSAASTPASNKNFHLQPSPLMVPASSTPPVVTIAPTHTISNHTTSDARRELDRHVASNSIDHRRERLSTESNSAVPSLWRGKDSPGGAPRSVYSPSRSVPSQSKSDESPVRGFQPYRHGQVDRDREREREELRPSAVQPPPAHAQHLAYDPSVMAAAVSASYPFHPAFMSPAHLQYSAFRPEESYERYAGYPGLRPPFLPFASPHSQLFPHAATAAAMGLPFAGLRYPSELAMQMSHMPPGMAFGGLMSPNHNVEREKLLLEQREKERKAAAEEAKHEAALKEKQREAEREAHERAMAASRHNEDRGHSSPRGCNVSWSSFSRVSRGASHFGQHRLTSSMQTAPSPVSKLHNSQGANLNLKDSSRHHHGHHHSHSSSPHHSNSSSTSPRVSAHSHHSSLDSSGAVPLLKKASPDSRDERDRWQQNRQSVLVSGKDHSSDPHMNHNSAELQHRHRLSQSLHDNHKPMNLTSDRDKSGLSHSQHNRSLLLEQDRRLAERLEKEKSLREQHHRDQLRMEQGDSSRPLSLRSPHGRSEEAFRPKLFKDHRTGHSEHHIPTQYEFDRHSHHNTDRTLHKDKTTSNSHDKAWIEQRRAALGHTSARSVQDHDNGGQLHAASAKLVQSNQYDYDKPHAESEFSYHLHEFYRKNRDYPRGNVPGEPVISKLDLEEKRIKEIRSSGIYVSSDSESDSDEETEEKRDRYRKRMERIATRSNLPLDKSEPKIDFFQNMGLTTQGTKTAIGKEQRRKRRKLLREDSPTPVKIARTSSPETTCLPPPARISQEHFQRELDYPHKCRFLRMFGLEAISSEKRRQLDKEKAAIEVFRKRLRRKKNGDEDDNGKENVEQNEESSASNSLNSDEPPQLSSHITALKVPGIVPNHLAYPQNPQAPIHVPGESRNYSPHHSQQHQPKPSQSNPHEKMVQPLQSRQLYDVKDIKKEPLSGERGDKKSCSSSSEQSQRLSSFSTAAILSSSSSSSRRTKPPVFEQFAQEFHQSVLRSTQEALANQRAGQSGRSSDSPRREMHVSMSTSSPSPINLGSSSSSCFSKYHKPAPFMWPGVEGVMDAYQRHVADNGLERRILQDHLSRLQMRHKDMSGAADQLRLRVNDLHDRKQILHREQDLYMRDIHLLKQSVLDLRK